MKRIYLLPILIIHFFSCEKPSNDCHLLSEVFRFSNELSDAKNCVQNLRELAGVNEELANILGLISRFFKKIS